MRVAFFEDSNVVGFSPLTLMRPIFELVCGRFCSRERIVETLNVIDWGAFVRDSLVETYLQCHSNAFVNEFGWLSDGPTLFINGRWLPDAPSVCSLPDLPIDDVGIIDDQVAYIWVTPEDAHRMTVTNLVSTIETLAGTRRAVRSAGKLVCRPWELIDENANQLSQDFDLATGVARNGGNLPEHVAILGSSAHVSIDPTTEIDPFVVIDARQGPVTVGPNAVIQAFSRLEGPCHVGSESRLFRANIRGGTTIGPNCRVGGEIEASILQGHVNKYHDGFLGHAYVCPWVNLGAETTNSDLKNDYSSVRVPISGTIVDSGLTKVGCFIGDHTKTALGSLFNTGSSIGAFCMILPDGRLLPKHIPSFCRIWNGQLDDGCSLEDVISTARQAMARRQCPLTAAEERLIRAIYNETRSERAAAIDRMRRKTSEAELARALQ